MRNLLAGAVVGVIAIPLSIALAVAIGMPPIAGLYTAAFAGAVASATGGSRFNITGPTAALVPLLSHVVIAHGVEALPAVGLMAGILLIAMWRLRLGRMVRFMPGLVIVGFTAGIGLSIGFGQLNSLLAVPGTDPSLEHFTERLIDTARHLGSVGLTTPLLGLGCIAFLVLWQRAPHRLPGPLIVVVASALVVRLASLDTPTIATRYGEFPRSFPLPSLGFVTDLGLGEWIELVPIAVAIAVLAAVESLLSAVVADNMAATSRRHDADRELLGQGLANLVSPLMGGVPATAAIARTAAGIRAGATSRLTGITHAVTVLVVTLAFGGLGGQIPLTALAAILLVVAWNIADVPEVMRLVRGAPREDLAVLLGTMAVTLVFDLTYAIGLGILVSAVLLIRRLTRVPAVAAILAEEGEMSPLSPRLTAILHSHPEIAFFNLQGVISFHSAAELEYELLSHQDRPLLLRMRDLHYIDSSGLITLEGIVEHRMREGGRVVLTEVQPSVLPLLRRWGILDLVGAEGLFESAEDGALALAGG
jgi:SulP family sulfate permease